MCITCRTHSACTVSGVCIVKEFTSLFSCWSSRSQISYNFYVVKFWVLHIWISWTGCRWNTLLYIPETRLYKEDLYWDLSNVSFFSFCIQSCAYSNGKTRKRSAMVKWLWKIWWYSSVIFGMLSAEMAWTPMPYGHRKAVVNHMPGKKAQKGFPDIGQRTWGAVQEETLSTTAM